MSEPIPLATPDLRGREAEYLARCVADNWVSSAGPFVDEFEARVAALAGRGHGVATASGTAALQLALLGLGLGPGDLVAVPDWTFAATANAVIHAGGTPLLVDVSPETWTLDPALLAEALEHHAGHIKAVVPVHTLGHPADMDAILAHCAEAGVAAVEDAAGAIGAAYKGRPAGAFGHAAIFSFNANKTVTAGGGGMIVSDDEALARRARHLSTQARVGEDYVHDAAGFNFRMTNLNAALGLAQLERLDEMVAAKRAIAARYDAALADRDDLAPMPRASWAEHGCWLYSLTAATADEAGRLIDQLSGHGIEARRFWTALSAQAPYAGAPQRLAGVSRDLSGRVVSLPSSSWLAEADQGRVIAALGGWRGAKLRVAA